MDKVGQRRERREVRTRGKGGFVDFDGDRQTEILKQVRGKRFEARFILDPRRILATDRFHASVLGGILTSEPNGELSGVV